MTEQEHGEGLLARGLQIIELGSTTEQRKTASRWLLEMLRLVALHPLYQQAQMHMSTRPAIPASLPLSKFSMLEAIDQLGEHFYKAYRCYNNEPDVALARGVWCKFYQARQKLRSEVTSLALIASMELPSEEGPMSVESLMQQPNLLEAARRLHAHIKREVSQPYNDENSVTALPRTDEQPEGAKGMSSCDCAKRTAESTDRTYSCNLCAARTFLASDA